MPLNRLTSMTIGVPNLAATTRCFVARSRPERRWPDSSADAGTLAGALPRTSRPPMSVKPTQ